jgi:hypothetical protein
MMNRDKVLVTAGDLINGDRAKAYGNAQSNFNRIATGWNTIVKAA